MGSHNPPGYFDLIAAGGPCTEYSQAKTKGQMDLEQADRLVWRTMDIVNYFNPTMWWIENPRWGKLRERGILEGLAKLDVDYCQFSDCGYTKPTRFWGSPQIFHLSPKLCNSSCPNKDPITKRHQEFLGGSHMKFSPWEKGRTPPNLIKYLLSSEPIFQGLEGGGDHPPSTSPANTATEGQERVGPQVTSNRRKKSSGLDIFLEHHKGFPSPISGSQFPSHSSLPVHIIPNQDQ